MKSVLVIGIGRFGKHLATKMQQLGNDVMIVDRSPELIEQLSSEFTDSYIGDCTNDAVVQALGVEEFDICFVTIGENFQSSLVITSLIKKHGARFIVAKANQDIQAELLRTIGANEIVYPEREIADKLAVRFNAKNIFDFVPLAGEYSIFEIPVPSVWQNRTIGELGIRPKYHLNVIAVKNGNDILPSPGSDYRFRENDHPVVLGRSSDVYKVSGK